MYIPKGFKPKGNLDEKTEELRKGNIQRRPYQVVHNNLTLEELESKEAKAGYLNLTWVELDIDHEGREYKLNFFPFHYDNQNPQIVITPAPIVTGLASIIAGYYDTVIRSKLSDYYGGFIIKLTPPSPMLLPRQIIYDLKNFFIPTFEDVKINHARYEDLSIGHWSNGGLV